MKTDMMASFITYGYVMNECSEHHEQKRNARKKFLEQQIVKGRSCRIRKRQSEFIFYVIKKLYHIGSTGKI